MKFKKLLKNQDRIPEEQLNEIMNSIENLFSGNTVDWIDAEFDDPKLNKLFFKIKDVIINQRLIELEIETRKEDSETNKVRPHKICIRDKGLYLTFYNIDENKQDGVLLSFIRNLNINL